MEVYARCAEAELLLNGVSAGRKRMKNDCVTRFRCAYEDGTITAVAYDEAGREIGRSSLRTAEPATVLRATPENDTAAPGGLSFIRLRYTDENGVVKPLERGVLRVTVDGGELLGLGSACPYNERGYLGTETDTYFGEALAVVRAGSGDRFTLTVTDGQYTDNATVAIREKPGTFVHKGD